MPENNPTFGAPSGDAEKSVLPQAGAEVTVAKPVSEATQAGYLAEHEYVQRNDNPLAPNTPEQAQPEIVKKILTSAEKGKGNATPGMNGMYDDPWTDSGMKIDGPKAEFYNPGSRGGFDVHQKTNKL